MLGALLGDTSDHEMTGRDGLATLRRVRATGDVAEGIEAMVALLRQRHYSIGNLLQDIAAVKAENGVETRLLDAVLAGCIDQTSRLHEVAIETMQHGFCELSPDGRIGYANPALQAMLPGCEGQRLAEYFPKTALIDAAVSHGSGGHTHQVEMKTPEQTRPVMVTIGPGEGSASFAFIMDLTAATAAERRSHDTAPFAILQLDPEHRITYANPQAGKLLGGTTEDLIGTPAGDLAADETARSALEQEFEKRRQGETSEYRLEVQPISGTPPEPMMVRSIPKSDPDGRLASTLVTFHRIRPEEVDAEIRETVAAASDVRLLFDRVIEKLRPLVAFDMAVLWLYTGGRAFSRRLFAQPSLGVDALWFPVPEAFRELADEPHPFGMIEHTLGTTQGGDSLSQEAVVQALRERKLQSWYALPIGDAEHDAVLVLYDKRVACFDEGTKADVTKAGVQQAMQAVLRLRAERETAFRFDLMRMMAAQRTDRELATLVVTKLAAFYQWQNVSIFKVNVAQHQFELLGQESGPEMGYWLPEGYCQAIGTGFLGKAYAEKGITVVNDAWTEPEKSLFVVGSPKTRSNLIVPVWSDGQVAWVLNIEDHRPNAFREPDVQAIRELMDKIGEGLGRLLVAAVLAQVLEEVPHAVVITDLAGRILVYNRCARDMIGDGAEKKQLDRFFAESPEAAEAVLQETSLPVEGVLTGANGRKSAVLVSARVPRIQYDRRVVFMQDTQKLALQSETREVMRALGEVAAETRIPLSLASSYIRQMGRQAKGIVGGLAEMAGRAAAQLATVELSYSRVVDRAQRQPQTESVALADVLIELMAQLPDEFARRVRLPGGSESAAQADRKRLVTAVRGMLAYMLRIGDGEVHVRVRPFRGLVGLSMSQALPPQRDERDVAMARFALDAPGLVQFAGLQGGDFRHRRSPERETLRLVLRKGEVALCSIA